MAELAEIRDVRTPDGKKLTRKRALAEKIWAKGIQDQPDRETLKGRFRA